MCLHAVLTLRSCIACRSYTGDYGEHEQMCDGAEQLPGLWQVPSKSPLPRRQGSEALLLCTHHAPSASLAGNAHQTDGLLLPLVDAVWRLTELEGPYQMDPGFKYGAMGSRRRRMGLGRFTVVAAAACTGGPAQALEARLLTNRFLPPVRAVGMTQASNASAFEILKANFLAAYNGNRAPMPVYVHSFFLREGNNQKDVERFLGG